jgi:hypothetical protein
MVISKRTKVLTDFSESNSNKYAKFTSGILSKLKKGAYSLPYQEYFSFQISLTFFRTEFLVINNSPNNLIYMLLVETGFSQEAGFQCLEAMKSKFEGKFPENQINRAKEYGLNKAFRGDFQVLYVRHFLTKSERVEY